MAVTYLLRSNRLLGGLVQLLNGLLVEAQILLATNEDDGQALAEVQNLGDPLREGVSRAVVDGGSQRRGVQRTFSWTLSRESGESMAKQMRMTCESG
jgi:hypothetical protein